MIAFVPCRNAQGAAAMLLLAEEAGADAEEVIAHLAVQTDGVFVVAGEVGKPHFALVAHQIPCVDRKSVV